MGVPQIIQVITPVPIGSMYAIYIYMVTFTINFTPNVRIYIPYMDPSWGLVYERIETHGDDWGSPSCPVAPSLPHLSTKSRQSFEAKGDLARCEKVDSGNEP